MCTCVFNYTDVEWWLAKRDLVQSEMDEAPRRSPQKVGKTTTSSLAGRRRNVLDSDDDDDDY